MSMVEFDRAQIERLLAMLDRRLQERGVAASLYVVGGAAIAVTVSDLRRTLDIDALASDRAVMEEARLLAESEGIPPTWLNESAKPWVPPRPDRATIVPSRPGLTVHWAPAEHLLAMKLVAMRPQDAPDIAALAHQVGLGADPTAYADLLERVYSGEGALQQVLGVADDAVRSEAMRRGTIAARLVNKTRD